MKNSYLFRKIKNKLEIASGLDILDSNVNLLLETSLNKNISLQGRGVGIRKTIKITKTQIK